MTSWNTRELQPGNVLIENDGRVVGSIVRGADGRWSVEILWATSDLKFNCSEYLQALSFVNGVEKGWATQAENAEQLEQLFDLQRDADARAVKRWREANPGKELTLPDRADLVVWLMNERDRLLRALGQSVRLQGHYAELLNNYDGGKRIAFKTAQQWLDRLATPLNVGE